MWKASIVAHVRHSNLTERPTLESLQRQKKYLCFDWDFFLLYVLSFENMSGNGQFKMHEGPEHFFEDNPTDFPTLPLEIR